MSFLLNLSAGLNSILSRAQARGCEELQFEVRVNEWSMGDSELPEYRGQCRVTPKFLEEFHKLCKKHQCGEKR